MKKCLLLLLLFYIPLNFGLTCNSIKNEFKSSFNFDHRFTGHFKHIIFKQEDAIIPQECMTGIAMGTVGTLSAWLTNRSLKNSSSIYAIPATIGAGVVGMLTAYYPWRNELLVSNDELLRKLSLFLGADINHRFPVTLITQDSQRISTRLTPLMIAAIQPGSCRDLILEKLFSYINDRIQKEDSGKECLTDRSLDDFVKSTKISLYEQDEKLGYTALHFALKNKNYALARVLMALDDEMKLPQSSCKGATIEDKNGASPFDHMISLAKKQIQKIKDNPQFQENPLPVIVEKVKKLPEDKKYFVELGLQKVLEKKTKLHFFKTFGLISDELDIKQLVKEIEALSKDQQASIFAALLEQNENNTSK